MRPFRRFSWFHVRRRGVCRFTTDAGQNGGSRLEGHGRRWLSSQARISNRILRRDRYEDLPVDDFHWVCGDAESLDVGATTGRNVVTKSVRAASYNRALKLSGSKRRTGVRACIAQGIYRSTEVEESYVLAADSHSHAFSDGEPTQCDGLDKSLHRS